MRSQKHNHFFSYDLSRVQHGLIQVTVRHPAPRGYLAAGLFQAHPIGHHRLHHGNELVHAHLGGAAAFDDDGDLAFYSLSRPLGQLWKAAAADFLVGLGQLAAHRGPALLPQHVGCHLEGVSQAVRGFKKAHGPRLRPQGFQPRPARPTLAWGEAIKNEPPHRQARQGQGGGHGRRAGQAGDGDTGGVRGVDKREPGVGHQRHAGIGDDEDGAGPGGVDKLTGAADLIVIEIGNHPAGYLHPERRRQVTHAARILRGDDVRSGQGVGQPGRGVADIAQRSCGKNHTVGKRFDLRHALYLRLCAVSTAIAAGYPGPRFAPSVRPILPRPAAWTRQDTWSVLVIGILALLTRFVGLTSAVASGTPVFDEKHYVPQAWDMVRSQFNPLIGGIESNPGYGLVVHPPLAKQIIALGEWVFGYTPLGWRFMVALFGAGTVVMTMLLVRRLAGTWQVAFFAGLLAVVDGVLLVSSRFGMLDIFQVFFIVSAAWALACDREQMRARMHDAYTRGMLGTSPWGPRLGFRWWRFVAGVFLGLALGVKWSGLYYMAFFGIMSVALDWALRRRYGVRRPLRGMLLRDALPAFASLVIVPVLLYFWSWRAWFASETSVYRHAVKDAILPDSLGSFFLYHRSVLEFHASLTTSGGHSHPWDSKPWSWLAGTRPVLYFSSTDISCLGGTCRRMIYLFGTPAIWWLTVPILLWGLWSLIIRRDDRFLIPLVAFAAGFLPWLAGYDRQMYFFYATALAPFTIALIALTLGQLHGRGKLVTWRWLNILAGGPLRSGTLAVIVYLSVAVAMFLYFSPILYGYMIPDSWYYGLMWLPSWS